MIRLDDLAATDRHIATAILVLEQLTKNGPGLVTMKRGDLAMFLSVVTLAAISAQEREDPNWFLDHEILDRSPETVERALKAFGLEFLE